MDKDQMENLIRDLLEKTTVKASKITVSADSPNNIWFSVEVAEPHFFIGRDGEALYALNHLVRRIIEARSPANAENFSENTRENNSGNSIVIDINGFQKKRIENIRAVAHMMGERARYFKSNIEVDPMSPFERRVVHEFLSDAIDLKTESVGFGGARRVVIKYIGEI